MYLIKNSTAILNAIQITRFRFVFALLAMAIMTAGCSDNPFNPAPPEEEPPSGTTKDFGLVEVTVSGIGTQQMSAKARPYRAGGNIAYKLTSPTGTTNTNNALALQDDSQEYVEITGVSGFPSTSFTVEAWVYPTSKATSSWDRIVSKKGDWVWGISTDQIQFNILDRPVGGRFDYSVPLDRWTHLALVYDETVGFTIYANGALIGSINETATPNTTGDFFIGQTGAGSQYFDGRIDEVRIWSDVRTQTQIQNNMNSEIAPASPGLFGYYPLNAETGTTAEDATANNRDGTLFNGAAFGAQGPPIDPHVSGGDGTIELEPVRSGSFTYGERGSGGLRYIFATFKVRNAGMGGTPYLTPRQNLTFLAVDTDQTLGATAVHTLRLFDGTELTGTTADDLAASVIPTGKVISKSGGAIMPVEADVLQALTETEAQTVEDGLSAGSAVVDVFPYGFVTRSPNVTPGSRTLPANPAGGQFDGLLTFAFKLPLQAGANQDPFEITMLFLPVDDSETRLTQSLEEQTAAGLTAFKQRANALTSVDRVTLLLPGFNYDGGLPVRLLCEVRAAGTVSGPEETFMVQNDYSRLYPDPYEGEAHRIGDAAFTAEYCPAVSGANDDNFVVQGFQSGKRFIGQTYPDANGPTVSTPAGTFFPGEIVEVTLTSGLGITTPRVARYRVRAGGGGSFNEVAVVGVGLEPSSVTAGDWDGDGDLDLAVGNFKGISVSILQNSGGSFTEVATVGLGNAPYSVTAGDWDGDGDPDLAVASNSNIFILGNSGGSFTVVATVGFGNSPISVTAGDWDGDGDLDLATTVIEVFGNKNIPVSILQNSGGSFTKVATVGVGNFPLSVTAGDWDGDGDLDLAVANYGGDNVSLLEGDGDGGFTESKVSAGLGPASVTAGDWDGDGDLDLAVANFDGDNVSLLEGDGDGGFTESTIPAGDAPESVTAGDWDGDGDLDLAVVNFNGNNVSILKNGGGSFTKVATIGVGNGPGSVTAGDWDGDGDLDLAVVNEDSDNVSILEKQ